MDYALYLDLASAIFRYMLLLYTVATQSTVENIPLQLAIVLLS